MVYSCIFVALLTGLQVAVSFDDASFCCNQKPSRGVTVMPETLFESLNSYPRYGQATVNNYYLPQVDNLCNSVCIIDNSTLLLFRTIVYVNGSVLVEKFIIADLPGHPGTVRCQGLIDVTGSSSFVFDEVLLDRACPTVSVLYRYVLAGRCISMQYLPEEFIFAVSSDRDISSYCKNMIRVIARKQNFQDVEIDDFPNRLNRRCVTRFNGINCVNAYRVRPEDSLTLPYSGPPCHFMQSSNYM